MIGFVKASDVIRRVGNLEYGKGQESLLSLREGRYLRNAGRFIECMANDQTVNMYGS